MEGSLIYLNAKKTKVLAYSFLHDAEENETLEFGWCGCEAKYIDLIPELVRSQIAYADKQEFQFITGEFDTTSNYAMKVLQDIPFPPSKVWVTYQKQKL